ncbi:MAG: hypothetical protein HZA61_02950 [Candidatus Eisenbacteria bacterium]|uniref:Uncharacterized protein n=1 Tax=Eiseniibacteriota bacterium TaxID=2212470 RepID=A0A933S9Y0_UNCEI|nr:hypothetical protein [Candidatus Eisenbacteria bacterium]
MKRVFFAVALGALAMSLVISPPARAQIVGPHFAWDGCWNYGGVPMKTFACDTNAGTSIMVASFDPPAGITALTGVETVIDLMTTPTEIVPDWWSFKNTGACRRTALTASFEFPGRGQWDCSDYWAGRALGGVSLWAMGYAGRPFQVRCILLGAIPQQDARQVSPDTSYYGFRLIVDHTKTVGDSACAGCSQPMCAVITRFKLYQPVELGDWVFIGSGLETVYWQTDIPECPAYVPARRTTWGALKSLYP